MTEMADRTPRSLPLRLPLRLPRCPGHLALVGLLSFLISLAALLVSFGLFGSFGARAARADTWGPPPLAHWSQNRRFVLRVKENTGALTLLHVEGRAEAPVWKAPSPMEPDGRRLGVPHIAYVRGDGRAVVLRDRYSQLGYGEVLVFLDDRGRLLRAYTLCDLFSTSEVLAVENSISSIWWAEPGLFRFSDKGETFGFVTHWGAVGVFDPATGERLPSGGPEAAAFLAEARQVLHRDLSGSPGGDVARGVMLAGLLKDRASVPILKQLLTDPAHCRVVSDGGEDDYFGTQVAAGDALVRILGKDAAPLLETRLARANLSSNPSMATAWIEFIAKAGAAARSPAVLRCARGGKAVNPYVRTGAIRALIENGGVPVVRRHPAWLGDRSEHIRYQAVSCLAEGGDQRDLPSLRRATGDTDTIVQVWALRGLIRLKPPDLDALLRRHLDVPEVRIALADRGDAAQLRWCVVETNRFAAPDARRSALGSIEVAQVARVLARRRPAGTREALTRVGRLRGGSYTAAAVGWGGLAALGDGAALARVRAIAARGDRPDPSSPSSGANRGEGDVFAAVEAIEWLGICRDRASVPLLRSLLVHREVLIRDAARDALKAMQGMQGMKGIPDAVPTPPSAPAGSPPNPAPPNPPDILAQRVP